MTRLGGGADGRARRELAAVLLAGAAGAGIVLLATRQRLAEVIVRAPRPLPATVSPVSVQDVHPAIAALAVAAIASLAAVLATRGALRRLTGLATCALGAGIALLAATRVTSAAVAAAAGRAAASPTGAGTAAGSATAGSGPGSPAGSLAGLGSRVLLSGSGWQALIIAGAALIAAAGIIIVVRATRLPAMSGRYDRPAAAAGRAAEPSAWDAMSAGADPTIGP
jgi:tryptophan-associated transmembrane protein